MITGTVAVTESRGLAEAGRGLNCPRVGCILRLLLLNGAQMNSVNKYQTRI